MPGLILLASYPKSGNTWLRLVLGSALRGGAPISINQAPFGNAAARSAIDQLLALDSADLRETDLIRARPALWARAAAQAQAPLILKTHDAWLAPPGACLPFESASVRAVIHIVRDPRDVAISLSHHLGLSLDGAIAVMADGGYWLSPQADRHRPNLPQFLSSWSRHTTSWLGSDLPGAMVRYEDMLADPADAFGAALAAAGLAVAPEALAEAISQTRFGILSAQERQTGFAEQVPGASAPFFRQGKAGGWRRTLSASQAHRIEADHGLIMKRLGYLA